jgi:hypothetical protein
VRFVIHFSLTGSSIAAGANVTFESGSGPAPAAADIVVAPDGKSLAASITAKSGGPPTVFSMEENGGLDTPT